MDETEALTAHPLFTLEENAHEEEAPPEVHFIAVTRWDAGQKFTAPHLFRGDELISLDQLFGLYGGGKYELIARTADNSRIVARRTYILPGESKPLFDAPAPKQSQPDEMAQILATVMKAQQPAAGGGMQTVLALLTVLGPVIGTWLQNQSQQAQAQLLAQQNLMATVMTTATQSSDKLVTAMAQIYNARPAHDGGSGGGSAEFLKGVSWAQELVAGQMEGRTENEGEPSIKDMMGLAMAYLQSQGVNPHPAVNGAPTSNGAAS